MSSKKLMQLHCSHKTQYLLGSFRLISCVDLLSYSLLWLQSILSREIGCLSILVGIQDKLAFATIFCCVCFLLPILFAFIVHAHSYTQKEDIGQASGRYFVEILKPVMSKQRLKLLCCNPPTDVQNENVNLYFSYRLHLQAFMNEK